MTRPVKSYHLKTRIAVAVSFLTMTLIAIISLIAHSFFVNQFKAATFRHISYNISITAENLSNRARHALNVLELIRKDIPLESIDDPGILQAYLDDLHSEQLVFDNNIGIFSSDGTLKAITPLQEDILGGDFSSHDYIKSTLLNQKSYISEPFTSRRTNNHPAIMLTEPIFDEHDRVIAILGGSFDLYGNNFLQTLVNNKPGDDGYYVILDQQKKMIIPPGKENVMRPASLYFPQDQIRHFLLYDQGLVPKVNINGHDLIGAFQRIEPLNWTLVSLTPLSVSYQPMHQARNYTVIALGALFIVMFLLIRAMTNRLTSPLTDLLEKVRLLANQPDAPIDLGTHQYLELGDLSESIMVLINKIDQKRKGLNDQLSFLENLIDTIPGPIFYKDAQYKYIGCNRAFEEFIGINKKDLIGKSTFDIAPANLANVYHNADVELMNQGEKQVYESSVKYADGSIHDVIFYKSTFKNAEDMPAGMIGIILDISDRKKSENALQASEKRFRLLVENAGDAFFLHDENGQIIDVNQQTCSSLGYSRQEILEMTVDDISLDYNPEQVKELLINMKQAGIITVEDHHRRKDGSSFPVELRLCHTEQEGGVVIALARDITDRKQAEAKLHNALHDARTAKNQVDNILQCAAEGIVVTNKRNRVTHINHIAEEVLNIKAENIIGKPFTKLFPSDHLRDQAKHFFRHRETESELIDFNLNLFGAGSPRIVQLSSSILLSDAGNFSGTVNLLRDVTRERELDQLKTEFISTAAHEMRTPMAVIMGYIELLTDPILYGEFSREQTQEFLLEAYHKAESLTHIVDCLFDISRIEAGLPLPIDKAECDLKSVLTKVVEHFSKHSKTHNFRTEFEGQAIIHADSNKLTQVFENLISNAVKYSPEGGGIKISAFRDGENMRIDIEDQGCGMTEKQVEHIFDKFYRVDSSDTAVSGLGLGMSIVKAIVEGHSGRIWVKSSYGQGTCISLEIPRGMTYEIS